MRRSRKALSVQQRVVESLEQSTAAAQAHVLSAHDFEAAQLLMSVEPIDISVQESWFWAYVLNSYAVDVTGTVIKKK